MEGAPNERLRHFYRHWDLGVGRATEDNGESLGVEKYWVLSQSGEKCLPSFPRKEALAAAPGETSAQGLRYTDPGMKEPGPGMQTCNRAAMVRGAESSSAISSETTMHRCGEGSSPGRPPR